MLCFVEHTNGLYLLLPSAHCTTKFPAHSYSCVSTVTDNRAVFTCRELEGADRARQLYRTIRRPSQQKFETILDHGSILNCPVTKVDAQRANIIYRHDLAYFKGKTTEHPASPHVATQVHLPLPAEIAKYHLSVTLYLDFFYIQCLPFVNAISRKIGYRQAVAISDRAKETMISFANKCMLEYTKCGFEMVDVHADKEFECLRESLGNVSLEICWTDKHVPEVKCYIRTMKETMQATAHGLPYRCHPKLMVVELVAMATHCLNGFPKDDGVSEHMSPHSIITGWAHMDYNKLPLEFGSYVQLLDQSVNTLHSRTIGAIALNPMGDETGTYHFMSLKTSQMLTKGPGSWTEVPITDIAIACMEALAKCEGQPMIQDSNLLVEWQPNQPFDEDDEYDDSYEPSIIDGEDDIELEIDDISENTDGAGSVTRDLFQLDLPVTEPVPKQITQSQVEDDGIDTLVEDEANIEEGNETCIAEEEGAVHVEEEGAVDVEEEGASVNMDSGNNDTGNSEGAT